MLSIDTLTAFSLAALLLCISPGPSNLYIMARSISQGQKAGMIAASGMALGSFIYVIASAFGLAAIFIYFPLAYTFVKFVGAAYLIYLSIQYLRLAKNHNQGITILNTLSSRRIFKQSLVVELTNPKTALFFIAFLPLFTEPSQGHMTLQLLILGTIYALIGLLSDLCVATLSGKIGRWMNAHPHSEQWQNRLSALLLFTIGVTIVYDESLKFLI